MRRRVRKIFVGKKIVIKFWFTIYAYCISLIDIWVKNQSFSKMGHDLYLMTTLGFWEFEKPWCVHFWRGWWWFTKNVQSFCFASTKLEWRLKRHWPLEGYTFILPPRELTITDSIVKKAFKNGQDEFPSNMACSTLQNSWNIIVD